MCVIFVVDLVVIPEGTQCFVVGLVVTPEGSHCFVVDPVVTPEGTHCFEYKFYAGACVVFHYIRSFF